MSKRRGDPAETAAQSNNLKVNDLVLVRDVTSGAFAPRYMPNYRIVAIHGPNRIGVIDEKGNEMVRKASHLKVIDLKEKVMSMMPEQSEYSSFGRNMKLLIHAKDIPDLQFTAKTEDRGKILPDTSLSVAQSQVTEMKNSAELRDMVCKIPPKVVEAAVINVDKRYIVGHAEEEMQANEDLPRAVEDRERGNPQNKNTWFHDPVNCVSKWSKALKMGLVNSMGLNSKHTTTEDSDSCYNRGLKFGGKVGRDPMILQIPCGLGTRRGRVRYRCLILLK